MISDLVGLLRGSIARLLTQTLPGDDQDLDSLRDHLGRAFGIDPAVPTPGGAKEARFFRVGVTLAPFP